MLSTLLHLGMTILLLTGWCLITTGVGRLGLGMIKIPSVSRGEQLFLSAGIGLAVTGYTVFLLGMMQGFRTAPLVLLAGIFAVLAVMGWLRTLPIDPSPLPLRSPGDRAAGILLGVLLAAGLFLALTPEIGKDALIYHLAVPKLYLLNRGFTFIRGNVFAGYPLLGEMQYLAALFFQGDVLARSMHFVLLGATLLGIGLFSVHLLKEHRFPALSMLIFASIPSVFSVSHTAYNDLFVAFFTLAALYTFLRWSATGMGAWLLLCALFSGSAAACKYTALLLTPLGCLGILWHNARLKSDFPAAIGHVAKYAALAFIAGSPFYLKNWLVTGNPFYPFFYGIFGGLGWDEDQARLYDIFIQNLGMGRTVIDYLLLPWNLSFRARMDSPRFDGVLGPIFLLILPFLLGKRHWEKPILVLLAYSVPTFLFWASSAQQIRYLIPLFALLAVAAGAVLSRYHGQKPIFPLLLAVVIGSLLFNGYHIVGDFLKIRPLPVVMGLESREAFLTRMIPTYPLYRYVNRELPAGSRVLLVYMKNFTFLCEGACYADAMFEAHTLQKILRASPSPSEVGAGLRREGFTHILYDETYLLGDMTPLSPEEKMLFLSFRERRLLLKSGPYRLDRLE